MKKRCNEITNEHAQLVVEGAPTHSRKQLTEHVRKAMQCAYDDGVRAGELLARERNLREMVAHARGYAQDANNRLRMLEQELEALLRTHGKITT